MERCPYCFKPIPENGICDCDYENSSKARIEEALHPGSVVGACYQIGAVLGRGGFGITYRGYDLNMERLIAIKEFFPSGLVTRGKLVSKNSGEGSQVIALTETNQRTYQKSLELFYREAKALGKLDQLPNVVHAHHIFRENGTAYIVMDFIEGEPLSDRIKNNGRIPEQELIPLLDPVLIALDKVHEMGILHRDIAPDNIMIRGGQPILLDFGAARVEENRGSSLLIGKKGYSSPEQLAGGAMGARSDIYSMGATYYAALSGITPQDSMMRTVNDQLIPLKELVPEISQNVSDAVMKAMASKLEDRWNNAEAFRNALNGAPQKAPKKTEDRTEKPANSAAKTVSSPKNEDVPEPRKKSGKGLWMIPVLLAALCAVGFFLFRTVNQNKVNESAARTAVSLLATRDAVDTLDARAAEDAENTRSAASALKEQAAQTAAAWEKETQAAFAEEQTATAWRIQLDAELRQTETRAALNAAETQTEISSRAEQTLQVQTLSAEQTREALSAEQTSTAYVATREAEYQQTQTRSAFDARSTRAAEEQLTVQAIRAEQTRDAEAAQTETARRSTEAAMSALQTEAVNTEAAISAAQTEAAISLTQEAVELQMTALAQTQAAMYAVQTKAAEPTSTQTPKPTATDTPKPTITNTPKAASLKVGDTITFGSYEQDNKAGADPIEWQVLKVEDGSALVISRYALETKKYNETNTAVTWETCSLRKWLNEIFFDSAFTDTEKTKIREVWNKNFDNPEFGTDGGNDTRDKIFLLSVDEVEKYMPESSMRQSEATAHAKNNGAFLSSPKGYSWWWLRSSGDQNTSTIRVTGSGNVNYGGSNVDISNNVVRPAFWLDLSDSDFSHIKTAEPTPVDNSKPIMTAIPKVVSLKIGDIITFGSYEQDNNAGADPIEWYVLAVEDGHALMLSRYGLEVKKYNEIQTDVTWETCSLRKWLNGTFYDSAFSGTEKAKILDVWNNNPDNALYGIEGGDDTQDKVFLLSISEVEKYIPANSSKQCEVTDHAKRNRAYVNQIIGNNNSWWWLRSPGKSQSRAAVVDELGYIHELGKIVSFGWDVVRPAFWLDLGPEYF